MGCLEIYIRLIIFLYLFLSLILQHNFLSLFCVFLLLVFCIKASSHSLAISLHAYNLNVIKNISACVRDNVFVCVFFCVWWNCVYNCSSKIINYFKNALKLPFYLNINLIWLKLSVIIFIYRSLAWSIV